MRVEYIRRASPPPSRAGCAYTGNLHHSALNLAALKSPLVKLKNWLLDCFMNTAIFLGKLVFYWPHLGLYEYNYSSINISLLKPFLIVAASSFSIEVLVSLEKYRVTQRVSLCIIMHGNNSESISLYTNYIIENSCTITIYVVFYVAVSCLSWSLPSITKQQKSVITGSRLLYILHALDIRITDLGITLAAEVEESLEQTL